MAIQKRNDNFFGHTQNTYVKISWILVKENWADENGKLYEIEALIDFYTNEDKIYHFSQKTEKFSDLRLNECSIDTAYLKLKQKDEFTDYEDII
jgi:hypothetical protein